MPSTDQSDARMEKAMRALKELPPFPATLTKLMASLANEKVSIDTLGGLVEKDTVVSGNILGIVNSALYARRSTVTSVRHALSLLGINKTRNVVLSLQVGGMWQKAKIPQTLSIARFNQHCSAVAILADLLSQYAHGVEYPEGAFVGGLLHDVGRLVLALGLSAEFTRILTDHQDSPAALVEAEQQELGFTHAILSGEALRTWKLPRPVEAAVRDHHSPVSKTSLAGVIQAADRFVNSVGLSTWPQCGEPQPDFTALEQMGLTQAKVEDFARSFQVEFEATAQFYKHAA